MSDAAPHEFEEFEVIVVGAGFNGLYQLKALRDAGWSVRLVEAGSGLGGVWHHNRYPGARVDCHVPNYEYSMPEIWRDWNWRERFPGRDELVDYFEHVDSVWDLRPDIDFETRIVAAHFDDDADHWDLSTDDGRGYRCRWLVMCTGFGSAPYVPDLPGLDAFAGECHHTARWPEVGLDLAGKRVGILGTGASGVQVAQEAAAEAAQLTIFQRTPVYALPMEQRMLTAAEQQAAKVDYPEVFRRRNAPPGSFHDMERDNRSARAVPEAERLAVFEDRWSKGGFHFWVGAFKDTLSNEESNRMSYDFWRDKTRARIADESLHESLAPTDPPYPFGTKRPSLEQNYYDIFDQPNVALVDLKRDPMVTITESGIQTESGTVELDVLVLATGFDANTGGFTRMDFRGAGGVHIADAWADGVDTHIGIAVPGFPNMVMLYGPQSAASFCNGPVCAELQGDWIVELLDHVRSHGISRFDTSPDHAKQWSDVLAQAADMTLFGKADSWYMGANIPGKRRQLLNMPNSDAYLKALADCAAAGYDGFTFGRPASPDKAHRAPGGIRAVLFDMGGVLVELDALENVLGPSALSSDEIWQAWILSPAVRDFERGLCSVETFAATILHELELEGTEAEFIERFVAFPRGLLPGARELVASVPDGIVTGVLSNTSALHWENQRDHEVIRSLCERSYLSYEMGVAKPDAEIYERAVADLGIPAEQVLFIDDNQINVDGARAVGLRAGLAKGPQAAAAVLAAHAIPAPEPA